jgi:hypothetical protein
MIDGNFRRLRGRREAALFSFAGAVPRDPWERETPVRPRETVVDCGPLAHFGRIDVFILDNLRKSRRQRLRISTMPPFPIIVEGGVTS